MHVHCVFTQAPLSTQEAYEQLPSRAVRVRGGGDSHTMPVDAGWGGGVRCACAEATARAFLLLATESTDL